MPADFPRARVPANADPQPGVIPRGQMPLDGFEPAVAAAAASRTQPQFTQGQVRVIHYDQNLVQRDLVITNQRRDCLAAGIHEGLWLTEHRPLTSPICSRQPRLESLFHPPPRSPPFGEPIENQE